MGEEYYSARPRNKQETKTRTCAHKCVFLRSKPVPPHTSFCRHFIPAVIGLEDIESDGVGLECNRSLNALCTR